LAKKRVAFLYVFVRAVGGSLEIRAGQGADFVVDGLTHFEVGGKGKGTLQPVGLKNAFLALDDIPSGSGNRIPLWLFGFLA